MAQRTNPVAEIIGIPNIRLYTAIDACGRRRSEIANFNTLDCYIYPGSTEEYWGRQDAAQAIALVLRKGLGLEDGNDVGSWQGYVDMHFILPPCYIYYGTDGGIVRL